MLIRSNKKAFTLAEVLVTLVVIGIVAALSIPTLLQNTNQVEFKTAFKKALAIANQSLARNLSQNSLDSASCCGTTSKTDLANFFANQLNVISSDIANASFYTADGMQYTVITKNANCSDSDSNDPTLANCVILVDVNNMRIPNQLSSGNSPSTYYYGDEYYMIVKQHSVMPASNASNDVALQALMQN